MRPSRNCTLQTPSTSIVRSPTGIDARLIRSGLFDDVLRDAEFASLAQSLPGEAWERVLKASRETRTED